MKLQIALICVAAVIIIPLMFLALLSWFVPSDPATRRAAQAEADMLAERRIRAQERGRY